MTFQVGDKIERDASAANPAIDVVVTSVKITPDGGQVVSGVNYDADGVPSGVMICAGGQCFFLTNRAVVPYSEAFRDAMVAWVSAVEATG